jgi:hypothetical protein
MKCEVTQQLKSVIMRGETNDTTKPSVTVPEETKNVKMKYEVNYELNSVIVREEPNDTKKHVRLVAKAQLTELPTAKDKQQLGPHQFAARLFNAEVNLISE